MAYDRDVGDPMNFLCDNTDAVLSEFIHYTHIYTYIYIIFQYLFHLIISQISKWTSVKILFSWMFNIYEIIHTCNYTQMYIINSWPYDIFIGAEIINFASLQKNPFLGQMPNHGVTFSRGQRCNSGGSRCPIWTINFTGVDPKIKAKEKEKEKSSKDKRKMETSLFVCEDYRSFYTKKSFMKYYINFIIICLTFVKLFQFGYLKLNYIPLKFCPLNRSSRSAPRACWMQFIIRRHKLNILISLT